MDDFVAGADLCEEHRLFDQARLLRAMAGPGGKLYLVAERGAEYNDNWYEVVPGDGEFRTVFTDAAEAGRAAELANVRKLREVNLRDFNGRGAMSSLEFVELRERLHQILGGPCALYDYENHEGPYVLPTTLTDEQMIAIARLFDKMQFFHVIEAEFGG